MNSTHPRSPTGDHPGVAPLASADLTWRLSVIAKRLGVSRRTLERERAAGRFPKPDLHIGTMPLWRPATIQRWIENGGRP